MSEKPTPMVDTALEEAMRRLYHTQRFEKGGIPKEFADFARRLGRALSGAEEALRLMQKMSGDHGPENPWGLSDSPKSFLENVRNCTSAALAQIEELRK